MTQSATEKITIRRARTIADYLFLRTLRNQVRQSMTNDTGLVTRLQQMRFFLAKPDGIEIYIARSGTERAGYLLLRHDKTTTLITEAVEPFSRRLGIAAAMVRYAQERHSDLTAEIRSGNLPSIALHRQAGFSFVTANGEIQTYRFCR